MIDKLRKLSDVLPDLWAGIFFCGVVAQAVGVFLVKDKVSYSIGLWIGVAVALAMAAHMAWSLYIALPLGEEGAVKAMTKHNLLRYGGIVLILGIVMVTEIGNPIAAFVGIESLKVAAYLQPITHKIFRR